MNRRGFFASIVGLFVGAKLPAKNVINPITMWPDPAVYRRVNLETMPVLPYIQAENTPGYQFQVDSEWPWRPL